MRRSRVLMAVLAVFAVAYAMQFLPRPFRAYGAPVPKSLPLAWRSAAAVVVVPGSLSSRQESWTFDAPATMLIPTEIPADSTKLLPNFTPPAPIRLLAGDQGLKDMLRVARSAQTVGRQ